ncbi:MAG: glycoside hydrolase family 3 protein [Clostridiales bacterium]|nr:glycoside hydrolase family 3 protein [Clostridiales bacterium]
MKKRSSSKMALRVLYTLGILFLGVCIGVEAVLLFPQVFSGGTEETSAAVSSAPAEPEGEQDTSADAEQTPTESTAAESAAEQTEADSSQQEPESEQDTLELRAQEILAEMSLTERVYQLFIVTQEQLTGYTTVTQSGSATKQAIQTYPVGGIIYFAANIIDPDQCTAMISNIQSYSKLGLFIAVDEEGGRVARVANNAAMGTTVFPSMEEIGSTGDPDLAYEVGNTIGSEIAQFGFNLDFAPVADVNSNPDNPVIGERAFSSDADVAAEMVAAAVQGFRDSGVLCTLKHFPGHGDTTTDSHLGYTEVTKTLDELRALEFKPFQAGIDAGADFVMVGHLSVPQVTGDDLPATLSKTMIDLLKDELGFEGLIITDSMSMSAITDRYSSGEAAVLAVQAGVDILLMPADLQSAASALVSAVEEGAITEERINESVLKILKVKLEHGIIT